jgi:hypothetical protein
MRDGTGDCLTIKTKASALFGGLESCFGSINLEEVKLHRLRSVA